MAATHEQIINFLLTNPSDAEVAKAMETYGVSPADVARATGTSEGDIAARVAATIPQGQSIQLGDTWVTPQYQIIGSGEDQQIGGIESVYTTKVGDNGAAGTKFQEYTPTGQFLGTGTNQEVGSFFGGLADALNDPVVQAAFLGLGGGGALGNALGLTGSTAQAVGTGLFKGGTAAAGGADLGDALKAGLLSGGLVYGGNEIANAIKYQDIPVDFNNMTQEQINDALDVNFRNDLARAGLSDAQIKNYLTNPASVYDATQAVTEAVTQPVAVSTPVTDTVSITAPTTPSLSNVIGTIASTTPTVSVAAPKATQNVDQATMDLINSQIAANVKNPSNLANLEVTGNRPATVQEVVNAITATLPTVTPAQAATVAEQVVTGNRQVTTQEVINAITASLPNAVTTPTQTITGQRPITTQEIVNAITASLPTIPSVTSNIPTQTIIDKKPSSITDVVTAATIPLIQPSTPLTVTPVTPEKPTTPVDPLKVAQLGLTAAGLLGAGSVLSNTNTPTGFEIVPVPEGWKTPPKTGVAPFTPLPPINFGDRNLLIGTQWEKFLDPNYGKVSEPVKYSQPSNLSYNDLMSILGSKQGMPPASSLTINDIISGIQNQYGQAPAGTMG